MLPIKKKKNNRFLVNFARCMFMLKGQNIQEVASKLGIPTTNLQSFFNGVKMSIAPEHAVKLFYHLGIGKTATGDIGFQPNCVHNFTLDLSESKSKTAVILKTVFKILPKFKAKLVYRGLTVSYILIAHEDIRIVLKVKKKLFVGFNTSMLGIKVEDQAQQLQKQIPEDYKKALLENTLGFLDFDSIFFHAYENWGNLRSIANVHGIPFADVLMFLKTEARKTRRYSIVDFQKALSTPEENLPEKMTA